MMALPQEDISELLDIVHDVCCRENITLSRVSVVVGAAVTNCVDPLRVTLVRGHHNWICVAYPHFVCCFR